MIKISQVNLPAGTAFEPLTQHPFYEVNKRQLFIPSTDDQQINERELTLFPGLIDPHVHFRTPGQTYKEDWRTAAMAALRGGFTTVFDMPNNQPPCVSLSRLQEKQRLIQSQLQEVGIPLRYELYIGADKNHFDQLVNVKPAVIAIKVFMGSSTGDLLMDDASSLHAIFSLAAHHDMLVALHAEDEAMIKARQTKFDVSCGHHMHSQIRTPEVAAAAIEQVVALCRLYGTRAYILHVSSMQELDVIAAAKREGLSIYAETSPHHLFLNTQAYEQLAAKAQMNPPLRSAEHQPALFKAIAEGIIDTIGSDHAPHTLEEKNRPYPDAPSGVPGIETNLPLLLNAYHQGKITLHQIAALTCRNIQTMFRYRKNHEDLLLIDLNQEKVVEERELKTKCGWSPFAGWSLKGWPVYAVVAGQLISLCARP